MIESSYIKNLNYFSYFFQHTSHTHYLIMNTFDGEFDVNDV